MQLLRTATLLHRLVLAGFLWALGASVASPLMAASLPLDWICSADGTLQPVPAPFLAPGDLAPAHLAHALDCPLCLPSTLPPPVAIADTAHIPRAPLARASWKTRSRPLPVPGAALPPRGPPVANDASPRRTSAT